MALATGIGIHLAKVFGEKQKRHWPRLKGRQQSQHNHYQQRCASVDFNGYGKVLAQPSSGADDWSKCEHLIERLKRSTDNPQAPTQSTVCMHWLDKLFHFFEGCRWQTKVTSGVHEVPFMIRLFFTPQHCFEPKRRVQEFKFVAQQKAENGSSSPPLRLRVYKWEGGLFLAGSSLAGSSLSGTAPSSKDISV